jgi:GTP cyclohydrolase IA
MEYEGMITAIKAFIAEVGDNPNRDGLKDTPTRVYQMWKEFRCRQKFTQTTFECANYDEIIIVKDIPFYSFCEHHLLPFFGQVHIGYIPNDKGHILGLSKIARLVDAHSLRFTLQEGLTVEIAGGLNHIINPLGIAVVISARHLCMEMRGVKKQGQETVTSAMLGVFRDNTAARSEFLSLIKSS